MARLRNTIAQQTGNESAMNSNPPNPYKIVGNKVMHEKGGRWSTKQTATSPQNAKKAVRLLNAIEHGYRPTKGR